MVGGTGGDGGVRGPSLSYRIDTPNLDEEVSALASSPTSLVLNELGKDCASGWAGGKGGGGGWGGGEGVPLGGLAL